MAKKEAKTPFDQEVGARLALLRRVLGMTQEQFAPILGCSRSAVSNYEVGFRTVDPPLAVRIFNKLRVPEGYLFRGDLYGMPRELRELLEPAMAALSREQRKAS